jgi:nanoRNase/pAp phosphatase (c-di-AMP/oligoRNAs hydrolase)
MDDDTQNQATSSSREQTPKQQVVESLKGANNVLITISNDPTVDQLAACIGLTLMMNKLGKHATAVFSGAIPSTLDFLDPGLTIEQNTDSLRDFIISLDKSKADKLRYKVEDEVVRIYITPYKTSISDADLDFTQGDFNVDVVVALGIYNKDQLDGAIIEHGQILHDAVVIDISCGANPAEMGSINWHEPAASSLSEMLVSISEAFKTGLLDEQMATAFLTGIVAETERFSNDRTTPKVMTISAQLMAAGANQQLIANQLAIRPPEPEAPAFVSAPAEEPASAPGELSINHADAEPEPAEQLNPDTVEQGSGENGLAFSVRDEPKEEDHTTVDPNDAADILGASGDDVTNTSSPEYSDPEQPKEASQIEIDEHGNMVDLVAAEEEKSYTHKKVIQPLNAAPSVEKTDLSTVNLDDPSLNAGLPQTVPAVPQATEASVPGAFDSSQAPPELQPVDPASVAQEAAAPAVQIPNPADQQPHEQTLQELEIAVDSPHVADLPEAERKAMAEAGYVPEPPSTLPQFPLPTTETSQVETSQSAPPPVPPPFMPPAMQPQPDTKGSELNLPTPQ